MTLFGQTRSNHFF